MSAVMSDCEDQRGGWMRLFVLRLWKASRLSHGQPLASSTGPAHRDVILHSDCGLHEVWLVVPQTNDKLTKQGVRPREPGSREDSCIILPETFVHDPLRAGG